MKLLILLLLLTNLSFAKYTISGNINGLSGEHPILVNVFDEESWSKRKFLQQIVIPITETNKTFEFIVTPNYYGLVVIEDKDKNGKMSFGLLGPSEPAKVYNLNKIVFGPPNFDDFKFNVSSNVKGINLDF